MTEAPGGAAEGGALNLAWARRWVDVLIENGVTEVQLCPGSRSTPLVLAFHERPEVRIRVHIDERSAAFFALGFGRRGGRPSVVLTTSGTAVANLLPAAVEGATGDVPLILMTADRPARLRGTDANQTVCQPGLFAGYVRATWDVPLPSSEGMEADDPGEMAAQVVSTALGPPAGPVHVNVPFEKPLHPERPDPAMSQVRSATAPVPAQGSEGSRGSNSTENPSAAGAAASEDLGAAADRLSALLGAAARPVLIAGPSSDPDQDGAADLDLASRLNIPILADPLSGARFTGQGADLIVSTHAALFWHEGAIDRLAPDLILRTGRTFTSAPLERALLRWAEGGRGRSTVDAEGEDEGARAPIHVVVDAGSVRKDHLGLADHYLEYVPAALFPRVAGDVADGRRSWTALWQTCERAAREALVESLRTPGHEAAYVAAAVRAAPDGSTVFVSNSMPVRDLDLVGDPSWGPRRESSEAEGRAGSTASSPPPWASPRPARSL